MKYLILFLASLQSLVLWSQDEIPPPIEDRNTLEYPFQVTPIFVGKGFSYQHVILYRGLRGHSDILYIVHSDSLEKVELPEMFAKKRLAFRGKTDVSLFFSLEMNSKKKMAFHIREKRWMSVPKLQGHDGEDEIH